MKHPKRRIPATLRLAALSSVVLLIASACGNKPLDTMAPNSPIGGEINRLFWGVMIVAIIVFVLVQGAVIYLAWRNRVAAPDDPSMLYPDEDFPEQVHGNDRFELLGMGTALGIMATVFVFTAFVMFGLTEVDADPNNRIDRITVVGQQWWWEYHYYLTDNPDEVAFVTANEVIIPVDEEVELEVTSRDVIHSFWIPRLNGKRDAVPGRSSKWTLEGSFPGRYYGQCTEFCGLSHAYMRMFAVAVEPTDFDTWAANQAQTKPVLAEGEDGYEGQQLFLAQCATCHVISGVTDINADGAPDDWSLYGWDGESTRQKRIIPGPDPDDPNATYTQVSGAAPNLTHLMTRTSFGGAIFDMYTEFDDLADFPNDETGIDYIDVANLATLDRGQLEAWIRNAPAEKANAWDNEGGQRGMTPFLGLTGEELDHIVDYLITLD